MMQGRVLRQVTEVSINTLPQQHGYDVNLAILAGANQWRALLLIDSVDVSLLLFDQVLRDLQVTQLTRDTKWCIIVEVLDVDRGTSLHQGLDDGQRAASHRVMQWGIFIWSNRVDIRVELRIVLKVFIFLIKCLLLEFLVGDEHVDLLEAAVLARQHQRSDPIHIRVVDHLALGKEELKDLLIHIHHCIMN